MAGKPRGGSRAIRKPATLSAHALAGEREKALAAGCNEFDTKPIEFIGWSQPLDASSPISNDGGR
jgi:hypothetical protein